MYGFTQNTSSEGMSSAILRGGKHDNVFLKEVKFDKLKDDAPQPVLQFLFEDKEGRQLNHIEWAINKDKIAERLEQNPRQHKQSSKAHGFQKGAPIAPEEQVIIEAERQGQRIKHIARRFMPNERSEASGGSWEEFGNNVVKLFTSVNYSNIPLQLKVILDNNDYSKLPMFPAFVKRMDEDDVTLIIDPQYDRIVPMSSPTADPAAAAKASDPFASQTSQTQPVTRNQNSAPVEQKETVNADDDLPF